MKITLPESYSGRQILDAFAAAISLQDVDEIDWEIGEHLDRVEYQISSAPSGEVKTIIYKHVVARAMRKKSLRHFVAWLKAGLPGMSGGELVLAPLREGSVYEKIDIFFGEIPPEEEGNFLSRGLGTAFEKFLQTLIGELRKKSVVATQV